MDEKVNQQTNEEYEIWVNEAHEAQITTLILKGNNIDELLDDAKRMYPHSALIIKYSPDGLYKNLKNNPK
ncbi:MAG: hypothetical protein CVT89_04780 [Candidatus Altiarchaeales archaeon HGW-Altiarchaeales-2]|nr:MAG: hypothetical protein CVT89_04780 [Candidatus Altiarchaeales archaeon HGW-Altiarchaeales-2]